WPFASPGLATSAASPAAAPFKKPRRPTESFLDFPIVKSYGEMTWVSSGRNCVSRQPMPAGDAGSLRILREVIHKITLIPGDGIGPEVSDATVRLVNATGVAVEWEKADAGIAAERATGSFLPEAVFESLAR